MGLGGLPAGYDAWRTRTPWDDVPEHMKECPCHEDNHDGEPAECICPTPAELAADRAEEMRDRKRDREDERKEIP